MSDDGAAQASVAAGAVMSGGGSPTKSETGGGIAQQRGRTHRHGCGSHSSLACVRAQGNEMIKRVWGCVCVLSLSLAHGGRAQAVIVRG